MRRQDGGKLLLALDQGGHASRALAIDARGATACACTQRVGETRIGDDRVEQDPEELVASLRAAAQECAAALEPGEELACAGLATQRSSVVCWDRETGAALSPVLSWQDRRAGEWLERFADRGEEIHARTGLFLSPHYGASKLAWCLENLEAVRHARAAGRLALGPLASFLAFRLLDERPLVADPANASRTLLWSLATRDWDPDLCALFGVPIELLPACVPTRRAFGTLDVLGSKVPFRVLTGDQSAAVFAWGRPRSDTAYVNVGTGAFVQRPSDAHVARAPRLLTSLVFDDGSASTHALEGTINGAGAALAWAGRELGLERVEERLEGWLRASGEPLLFLNGVSGLAAPFWKSDFRSRFVGEGESAQKIVAVLESVLFLARTILEEMGGALPPPARIVASGGLANADGLCERLASLTGLPVDRPAETEATSIGLAWLLSERREGWPGADETKRFAPREDPLLEVRYRRWRVEMDRALRG